MRGSLHLALAAISSTSAAQTQPAIADPHTEYLVQGRVLDARGHAAAALVVERVDGPHSSVPYSRGAYRTTTDASGAFRFAFSGLGTGTGLTWYLAVHRLGCADVVVTVNLTMARMPDGWDGDVARDVVVRLSACARR